MKKNAVLFTVSSDLVFAVASLMLDIKRLSPSLADEVVVLHNGISRKDLALLNSILPTRGIFYDIPVNDLKIFRKETLEYFTIMAFAKYEALRLLSDYKTVTYIDPDMVIVGDISDLLDYCESGLKMMPSGSKVSVQLHNDVNDYDMNKEAISACLFVFQDHANYTLLYDFCIKALNKYAYELKFAEQAIFDFMIQEYSLNICPLDKNIYSPHPTDLELLPKARVIHAYGQPKFWNGLENEQWNKNYAEWIRMGGSRFKRPTLVSKLKKIIKNKWS